MAEPTRDQIAISDFEIAGAMIRFGGSFVSRLGECFRAADAVNQARLKTAFPDYWATYAELVALDENA